MKMRALFLTLLILAGASCAQASMSTTILRNDYTASTGATDFTFAFPIFTKANITVLVDGTEQVLDTDFTVRSGSLPFESVATSTLPTTGFVRFVVARTTGQIISLVPKQPITQLSTYTIESFPARRIETDYDKAIMVSRSLAEALTRAPKLTMGSLKHDLTMEDPVALKVLRWKADLSGLENADASGSGITLPLVISQGGTGCTTLGCVQTAFGIGVGNITTTGSPASTQVAYFTGATSISSSSQYLFSPTFGLTVSPTGNPASSLSGLSLQQTTSSTTTRQFLMNLGVAATQGTDPGDVVGLYIGVDKTGGTANVWSMNTLLTVEAGGHPNASQGYELDTNNLDINMGDIDAGAGLATPVFYGLSISGASTKRKTAAILISENTAMWNRGIVIANNSMSATASSFQDLSNPHKSIDIRGTPVYGIYQDQPVSKNLLAGGSILGPVTIANLPIAGVLGRVLYTTDDTQLKCDNGSAWIVCNASAAGTVTVTGTPASGNLTKFSGAASITNGNLSGDVTTTDTLVTTLAASGASAGTYGQVTVNTKGLVTTGTIISDVAHGGTGAATFTIHGVLLGQTTAAFNATAAGAMNSVLQGQGAAADPIFTTTPTLTSLTLAGASSLTLGTGSSLTGAIIFKNATNANTVTIQSGVTTASYSLTLPVSDGTNGYAIVTNGSGVLSWASIGGGGGSGITSLNGLTAGTQTFANDTNVTITSVTATHTIGWAGTLAVARGGTGAGTFSAHGVLVGEGTSAFVPIVGSAGQVLQAQTSADPIWTPGPTVTTVFTTGSFGLSLGPWGVSTGNTGGIAFYELAANGTNFVGLRGADNIAANFTWTLPTADGTNTQCLSTNGAGILGFINCVSNLAIQTSTFAGLPAASGAWGPVRLVNDLSGTNNRGLFVDTHNTSPSVNQWVDLNRPCNVRVFGAKSDGTTNDALAVNAAFTAGCKTVFLPAGTVYVPTGTTPDGTRLVGEGPTAIVDTRLSQGGAGTFNIGAGSIVENLTIKDSNGAGGSDQVGAVWHVVNSATSQASVGGGHVGYALFKGGVAGDHNTGITVVHQGIGSGDNIWLAMNSYGSGLASDAPGMAGALLRMDITQCCNNTSPDFSNETVGLAIAAGANGIGGAYPVNARLLWVTDSRPTLSCAGATCTETGGPGGNNASSHFQMLNATSGRVMLMDNGAATSSAIDFLTMKADTGNHGYTGNFLKFQKAGSDRLTFSGGGLLTISPASSIGLLITGTASNIGLQVTNNTASTGRTFAFKSNNDGSLSIQEDGSASVSYTQTATNLHKFSGLSGTGTRILQVDSSGQLVRDTAGYNGVITLCGGTITVTNGIITATSC